MLSHCVLSVKSLCVKSLCVKSLCVRSLCVKSHCVACTLPVHDKSHPSTLMSHISRLMSPSLSHTETPVITYLCRMFRVDMFLVLQVVSTTFVSE